MSFSFPTSVHSNLLLSKSISNCLSSSSWTSFSFIKIRKTSTIGFSFECLDLHLGGLQRADLGDGKGWEPENFEYRETQWPGAPGRWVGACWESLYGGNHFRGEFSSEADFLNDFSKLLEIKSSL